jgi:hypothetical protein
MDKDYLRQLISMLDKAQGTEERKKIMDLIRKMTDTYEVLARLEVRARREERLCQESRERQAQIEANMNNLQWFFYELGKQLCSSLKLLLDALNVLPSMTFFEPCDEIEERSPLELSTWHTSSSTCTFDPVRVFHKPPPLVPPQPPLSQQTPLAPVRQFCAVSMPVASASLHKKCLGQKATSSAQTF